MSLLDENQSVISIITEKRRQLSISGSSSTNSLKQMNASQPQPPPQLQQPQEDPLAVHRASGAIPKKPLPSIIEPQPSVERKSREKNKPLTKAKSVSTSPLGSKSKPVVRQSSVPVTFEGLNFPVSCSTSSSCTSSKTSPLAKLGDADRRHLSPSTSDTSGIHVKGSRESLAESTDSGPLSDRHVGTKFPKNSTL